MSRGWSATAAGHTRGNRLSLRSPDAHALCWRVGGSGKIARKPGRPRLESEIGLRPAATAPANSLPVERPSADTSPDGSAGRLAP
jgi:hypothetical protein